ncbi:MAG TPA: type IA DNA topoisomerase [Candidatus Choladousia intestinavium]|uniref:DNA topoisomerase n=1 Tax=Candidatus Choladousia intestinavium TaxID=2840727 RepID=A0A9D1ADD5_9FIRM|nr:type IA DNA topoisomerase [Candidatus Choladousia intestinavium]
MAKSLFIAEKPSVAQEFAKALKEKMRRGDGYLESDSYVVTWCVGHLVTMSYPEVYDEKYKRWSLAALPFLPETFLYEVIPGVRKQYTIVSGLLNRKDVETIYVCTDSGREGEYIYRLVEQMAGVKGKRRLRVWIDSQTEEEILRGIREAKDLSCYDNLCSAAYLRAKEDYLMGINFSRLLTLKYGNAISNYLGTKYSVVSVGRVMTCVLGMIVRREREIRQFVKTPFYRVLQVIQPQGRKLSGEFRAVEGSKYYRSPKLYKENGFKEKKDAQALIGELMKEAPVKTTVESIERKTEKKNPPLLYNLAELQNECSRMFKISPDETLRIVQELYEKKLVTYPRTDARVLSTAVAKEIRKNLAGLQSFEPASVFAKEILEQGEYGKIVKSRYVNDKQITDHYAIIPTGQGLSALKTLKGNAFGVYAAIVRRFLSIFYPPAQFRKVSMVTSMGQERFFYSFKVLISEGYFKVAGNPYEKKRQEKEGQEKEGQVKEGGQEAEEISMDAESLEFLNTLKKGMELSVERMEIKEGETSPPKRYNSGSMILAMENAGQLIEDEELRAQIKSCGIGTSATRAEILKKLVNNKYVALNKKTQILTPTLLGEMIYDVVFYSIRSLLNPELTASWEKGLNYVANGEITDKEYMEKLTGFVRSRTEGVLALNNQYGMRPLFDEAAKYYRRDAKSGKKKE